MSGKKINASRIAKGELEPLGKRIEAHLEKMRGYETKAQEKAGVELRKADDHWTSITQLLAEAKAQCDAGGFKAFKKKYCPNLGRSRIYELLAIGSGKKTLEETRAKKRASVAKSRKKVSTTCVADKTEPADTAKLGASTVSKQAELANLVPADQSAEAIKARFAADESAEGNTKPEEAPEPAEVEATPADELAEVATEPEEAPKAPTEPARKKPIRKTPAPVGLDEASSAEQIGGFLERLGADRFFAALQFAPNLKAEIERRAIGVCAKKKTTAPPAPTQSKVDYAKDILGLPTRTPRGGMPLQWEKKTVSGHYCWKANTADGGQYAVDPMLDDGANLGGGGYVVAYTGCASERLELGRSVGSPLEARKIAEQHAAKEAPPAAEEAPPAAEEAPPAAEEAPPAAEEAPPAAEEAPPAAEEAPPAAAADQPPPSAEQQESQRQDAERVS